MMRRPRVLWLNDSDQVAADCLGWPEISGVEFESAKEIIDMDRDGLGYGGDPTIVSVPEGSRDALAVLIGWTVDDICLVTVRPQDGEHGVWWAQLVETCSDMGVEAVVHGRSQVASALAARAYEGAVRHLRDAADLLMGDAVQAGPDVMRLERACNRALDVLCSGAGIVRRAR
jgi:hypothetical protein